MFLKCPWDIILTTVVESRLYLTCRPNLSLLKVSRYLRCTGIIVKQSPCSISKMLVRSFRQQRHALLGPLMTTIQDAGLSPCCSGKDEPYTGMYTKLEGFWMDASLPSCSGRQHAWRNCSTDSTAQQTGNTLEEDFERNPHTAAQSLAAKLSPAQRAVLASALAQHTEMQQIDEKYWEELFRAHDVKGDSPGALSR